MVAQIDRAYLTTRPTKAITRLLSYALFEGRPITTRGRWINPLVFAGFALLKRLPQRKKVDRPVFILGTGRSGTTVLGTVLSMHRDVGFLNEAKALWHSVYPFEDVIGNYGEYPARYRLDASDVTDDIRTTAERLFSAYLSAVFSDRLVDKYPELIFRIPFVREIFPDAKFVLLIRNGLDTAASIEKWIQDHESGDSRTRVNWWGVDDRKWALIKSELVENDAYFSDVRDKIATLIRPCDRAVVEWIITMREGLTRLKEDGDKIIAIHYENLVQNPRNELRKIANFTELTDDEAFLRYGETVLRQRIRRYEVRIDDVLQPVFEETMAALGY